jgi:hypothetical protein
MSTVDELTDKLRLDKVMSPVASDGNEAFREECVDCRMKAAVIGPVRTVMIPPGRVLASGAFETLKRSAQKHAARLDH